MSLFHQRAAYLTAIGLWALQASAVISVLPKLHAAASPVPLQLNVEVGVVSVGHWAWVLLPAILSVLVTGGNALLARFLRQERAGALLAYASVFGALLFLFGSIAVVRFAVAENLSG